MQPFLKLVSLLVALLALTVALVTVVGGVLLLSFSGVQLPSLFLAEAETATEVVDPLPVVKALLDPATLWAAPDWASMESAPQCCRTPVWERVGCEYCRVSGSERKGKGNLQWDELPKLSFAGRNSPFRK